MKHFKCCIEVKMVDICYGAEESATVSSCEVRDGLPAETGDSHESTSDIFIPQYIQVC